jgi:hypothetical protein
MEYYKLKHWVKFKLRVSANLALNKWPHAIISLNDKAETELKLESLLEGGTSACDHLLYLHSAHREQLSWKGWREKHWNTQEETLKNRNEPTVNQLHISHSCTQVF